MLSTCEACDYNFPFNEALSACKLAHAKNCQECRERVPTIEEIKRTMAIAYGVNDIYPCKKTYNGDFQENTKWTLEMVDRYFGEIATAIHTLITGKI